MNFNIDEMRPYRDEVKRAMNKVVDSNWFIDGEALAEFEREWAEYTNQRFAAGVGSGTDAIAIGLKALGVGEGDEVITPAFNVAYTAMAISIVGATPVFVDVRECDLTIDPRAIEAAITPNTRAIVPVHLYGNLAQMRWLRMLAQEHRLAILEDAAQAHGSHFLDGADVQPGSEGDVTAWSFYPTKNLGALGDGGAITTNIPEVDRVVRLVRDSGRTDRYVHVRRGINSRLDEVQAAVLSVKLKHLDERIAARRAIAERYREGIADLPLVPIRYHEGAAPHLYVVRVPDGRRDALMSHLGMRGVPTLIHYPIPAPLQPALIADTYHYGPWPVAEAAAREVLSLPLHADLTEGEQGIVLEALRSFYE